MQFLFPLAILLASNTPFKDTQDRFTLTLAPCWSFAPQPGDVHGASFRCQRDKKIAHLVIKILPSQNELILTPHDLRDQWSEKTLKDPGYKHIQNQATSLAGIDALRHRFSVPIDNKHEQRKIVENWYALHSNKAIVIHTESLEDTFSSFEKDFHAMLKSLEFKGLQVEDPGPHPQKLVGVWLMNDTSSVLMQLKKDGTFDLDGVVGVWRVQEKQFWSRPLDGGFEIFTWELSNNSLRLQNKELKDPIGYQKLDLLEHKSIQAMEGLWSSPRHKLQLNRDGTLLHNKSRGLYFATPSKLFLKLKSTGQTFALPYVLGKKRLKIEGEPFGKPVTLKKRRIK